MYGVTTELKIQYSRHDFLPPCVLRLAGILCLLLGFFCGCGAFQMPDDYYQQVLEIENDGRKTQSAVKQIYTEPDDVLKSSEKQSLENSTEVISGQKEVLLEEEQEELPSADIKEPVAETLTNYKEPEPPRREAIPEAPSPKPIAVATEVIKLALSSAGLEINVRNLELVNGRLSGGKNSVRINFLSESVDTIDGKFVAICAVLYHLDKETKTIDVIIGIAEDKQSNLLAVLQSNMSDVAAWMNNELSPAEWRSRITKKIL